MIISSRAYILVGLPGSGKTTVGKALAQKLSVPFFDLDHLIEENFRVSIDTLIREGKESYFRLLELQSLKTFCQRVRPCRFVLATGGGTLNDPRNVRRLQSLGVWIYLQVEFEEIIRRLKEVNHALLARHKASDLENVLKERVPYYKEAELVVERTHPSPNETCLEIWRKVYGQRGFQKNEKNEATAQSAA